MPFMISSIYIRDEHIQDVKYLCRILDVSIMNFDSRNYDIEGSRSGVDRVLKFIQHLSGIVTKENEIKALAKQKRKEGIIMLLKKAPEILIFLPFLPLVLSVVIFNYTTSKILNKL